TCNAPAAMPRLRAISLRRAGESVDPAPTLEHRVQLGAAHSQSQREHEIDPRLLGTAPARQDGAGIMQATCATRIAVRQPDPPALDTRGNHDRFPLPDPSL